MKYEPNWQYRQHTQEAPISGVSSNYELSVLFGNMKISRRGRSLSPWHAFLLIEPRFLCAIKLSRDFCSLQKRETAAQHLSQRGAVEENQVIVSPCGELHIIHLDYYWRIQMKRADKSHISSAFEIKTGRKRVPTDDQHNPLLGL